MYAHVRIPAIGALLLATALGACDNGTSPGKLPADFDAPAVENAVGALVLPSRAVISPSAALQDAFPTLEDQGLVFDRLAGGTTLLGLPRLDVAATEIPSTLLGQTFVYDPQEGVWVVDQDRTDAPADAVRIIWNTTDAAGNVLVPLEERGTIDLTDADTSGLSQLAVVMVDTTASVTVAELTQGYENTTGTQWTEHSEAAGSFGDGNATVDFDLVSDASGNDDTGSQQATLSFTLDGPAGVYQADIQATQASDSAATDFVFDASLTDDDGATALSLSFTQESGGAQQGQGTISSGGTVVARITIDGTSYDYADADNQSLSAGTQAELDNLVRALFNAWIVVVNQRLPLLFP